MKCKSYVFILICLFFLSSVFAEEKITRTDITNISIETWIADNDSMCKVYFKTENMEGDSYFERTINSSDNNITDKEFIIRKVENLDCNLTSESMLMNYFNECETDNGNKSCRDAYTNCEVDKRVFQNISEVYGASYNNYVSCLDNKNYLEREFSNCSSTVASETEKRQNAETSRIWAFIGGIAIMFIIYNVKSKFGGRTREERELGRYGKTGGVYDYVKDLLNKGPRQEEKKEPLRTG